MISAAPRREARNPKDLCEDDECRDLGGVIRRLEYVLDHHGGSLDEDDEPGLTPETQRVERALRESIRFLRGLMGFVVCAEACAAVSPWVFSLGKLSFLL